MTIFIVTAVAVWLVSRWIAQIVEGFIAYMDERDLDQ